jgi:hypothetical protein
MPGAPTICRSSATALLVVLGIAFPRDSLQPDGALPPIYKSLSNRNPQILRARTDWKIGLLSLRDFLKRQAGRSWTKDSYRQGHHQHGHGDKREHPNVPNFSRKKAIMKLLRTVESLLKEYTKPIALALTRVGYSSD